MALTRKKIREIIDSEELSAEEKVSQIIAGHTDTVDALKDERDGYRETAERLSGVEAELNSLKEKGDGGWQKKYEDEHAAFENYKTDIAKKEQTAAKEKAYRELLEKAGIDSRRIDTVIRADRDKIAEFKLDDGGRITGADDVAAQVKTDWADFIATTTTTGVNTANPPTNAGAAMTRDEIAKIKNPIERQNAIAANINLYRKD